MKSLIGVYDVSENLLGGFALQFLKLGNGVTSAGNLSLIAIEDRQIDIEDRTLRCSWPLYACSQT